MTCALCVPLLIAGCSRDEDALALPETPVLSGQDTVALVAEEYVRLLDRPDGTAGVVGHGRRGDVLAVVSTTPDGRWIELDDARRHGWVRRDYLRLYGSREQALNAQEMLEE